MERSRSTQSLFHIQLLQLSIEAHLELDKLESMHGLRLVFGYDTINLGLVFACFLPGPESYSEQPNGEIFLHSVSNQPRSADCSCVRGTDPLKHYHSSHVISKN
jgi:hypothetical protein